MFSCSSDLRFIPCLIDASCFCFIGFGNIWINFSTHVAVRSGFMIHSKEFYRDVFICFECFLSICYNSMYLAVVNICLLTFGQWHYLLEFFFALRIRRALRKIVYILILKRKFWHFRLAVLILFGALCFTSVLVFIVVSAC